MRRIRVCAMAVLGACASAPPWSNGLGLRAQAPAQPPAAKGHSQDAEANALFDRAQDLLSHSDPRTGGTFANAREAIKLYQQAIDRDPHFALAYVQIARAWMAQGYSNPEAPPSTEIEAHSRSALKRALEINPNLTEAHQLQAQVHYLSDYNWAAAEREYRWAIEHDSNNASSHSGLAAFLATMGRFDEALAEAAIADTIRRSPADAFNRARIYYSMRNYDAAVENCRQALSTQENQAFRFFLGLMLIAQGHPQDGVTELERAASQGDNAGASLGLAYGYATIGRRGDALRVIERVRATHTEDQVVSYRLAAAYLALGDRDGAIRELQRDRDGHGNWIVQLKVDPVMDPLRNDPRFQQLMRTMKFPE